MVCAQIENGVFPSLHDEFSNFITVKLYTEEPDFREMQLDKHNNVALPLYVVEDSEGNVIQKEGGTINTVKLFRAWLKSGLKAVKGH